MIICPKHHIVFIHVPKAAGTSVRNALKLSGEIVTPRNVYYHATSEEIPKKYSSFHSFGVARNPWDRAASFYFWNKEYRERSGQKQPWSFEEFVENGGYDEPNFYPCAKWLTGVNTVLRFETLDEDFWRFCACNSIPHKKLRHVRPSKYRPKNANYSELYNDKTRDLVEARFREDIEKFGYTFHC
jgi:hypothetical protein